MLPNLPGYSFRNHRKTDFKKPQQFVVTAGLMGAKGLSPEKMEKSIQERSIHITATAPPRPPSSYIPTAVLLVKVELIIFTLS